MELNSKVFINSIVIATTGVVGYTLAGSLITVIGKKKLIGWLIYSNFPLMNRFNFREINAILIFILFSKLFHGSSQLLHVTLLG